jgi:hypothetical protein
MSDDRAGKERLLRQLSIRCAEIFNREGFSGAYWDAL